MIIQLSPQKSHMTPTIKWGLIFNCVNFKVIILNESIITSKKRQAMATADQIKSLIRSHLSEDDERFLLLPCKSLLMKPCSAMAKSLMISG